MIAQNKVENSWKLKNALFKQLIRESKIKAHLQNFLTCEFVIHGVTRTRESRYF